MSSKVVRVFSVIVVIILVLIGTGYYFLFSSGVSSAQLYVEYGEVFVNGEVVVSVVELAEGDVVLTGNDGLATIILYGSIVVNLKEGTEVSLDDLTKEHPQISQEGGETWNTFTKLSGVQAYSLKNGDAIASVRGTSFGIKDGYILGGEGEVSYVVAGQIFEVVGKGVVEVVDGEPVEREATAGEVEEIRNNLENALSELQSLRDEVLEDNAFLVGLIQDQTGLGEGELRVYMRQIDDGDIDLDELMAQAPVKTEAVKRIEEITRAILEIKSKIASLDE